MMAFLIGVLVGAAAVLVCIFLYVFEPWAPLAPPPPFIHQFPHIKVPEEIRQFLKSSTDGQGLSKWESCHSLSLFLHMFYQEHKDTRHLRRWMHKRLQMELNDIATRSAAGRLLQEIRIRDLSLGSNFPSVNAMRVESVEMADDGIIFEKVVFVVDIDYTGGFETSIDVTTMFGKKASLSVKITKLAGLVRFILSRQPYSHWTMSFVSAPVFETDIASQIQGHQLKRLIPLIKESIRRALQRKHVWPNYKIRYRPVFPNPLLQPSPPPSAFAHIKLEGGLEVTILQCTRLHQRLARMRDGNWEVYCTLTMDQRPFIQNSLRSVAHSINVMLVFSRYDLKSSVGITFAKEGASSMASGVAAVGQRPVQVADVKKGSLAEKAMFQPGDILVAINNVPIRSERQATRFLQQTTGDLMVLVDRGLDEMDLDSALLDNDTEEIVGELSGDPDDAFVALGCVKRPSSLDKKDAAVATPTTDDLIGDVGPMRMGRHSLSLEPSLPSAASLAGETTDSFRSSLYSLDGLLDRMEVSTNANAGISVQRTESARVPHVLVSQPSIDMRRSRSESQLNVKDKEQIYPFTSPNDESESIDGASTTALESSSRGKRLVNQPRAMDKDATLTVGAQLNASPGGSCCSLVSSVSARTDAECVTDADGGEEDDGDVLVEGSTGLSSSLNRNRSASTRRQRLQATIQAGKRKMFDFIPAKKRSTVPLSSESIEVGADANDLEGLEEDREGHSRSPIMGKRSPVETPVVDKKEKRRLKLKKSLRSGCSKSNKADSSPTSSTTLNETVRSRTTKPVRLAENVMWGQSLHFDIADGDSLSIASSAPGTSGTSFKYLNVTVHARETQSSNTPSTAEPKRPVLLGYTSLYIPQLIDDCNLTLSNCHREVFPLKPPASMAADATADSASISSDEFSRHAGFDRRLCYGDITLGFRYFPDGLPPNTATNPGDQQNGSGPLDETAPGEETSESSSSQIVTPAAHEWIAWNCKTAGSFSCAMCRGKIWLKSASCCRRCQVVCHSKCVGRAATGIVCTPRSPQQTEPEVVPVPPSPLSTAPLEPLDLNTALIDVEEDCPVTMIPSTPLQATTATGGEESVSRRTRLKNKVSEKLSSWRRGGRKRTDDDEGADTMSRNSQSTVDSLTATNETAGSPDSPLASIQDCLADVLPRLEGSPFIENLYFQPGNAYNETTISNAKLLGKQIFAGLETEERKICINKQIDIIQEAIRLTKDGRLAAMKEPSSSSSFEGLDERLQALAVLMLHYCAALQDCCSQGRASPTESMQDENMPVAEETAEDTTVIEEAVISKEDGIAL